MAEIINARKGAISTRSDGLTRNRIEGESGAAWRLRQQSQASPGKAQEKAGRPANTKGSQPGKPGQPGIRIAAHRVYES